MREEHGSRPRDPEAPVPRPVKADRLGSGDEWRHVRVPTPVSVFDLFTVGIGPSSSHTVGPMRAAGSFVAELAERGLLERVVRVCVDLFGSLGATGSGHGSDMAVTLGLEGDTPDQVDTATIPSRWAHARSTGAVHLLGAHEVSLSQGRDLRFRAESPEGCHPNAMSFRAFDRRGVLLACKAYFSVGGGVVVEGGLRRHRPGSAALPAPPLPYGSARGLLRVCGETGLTVSQVALRNELTWRTEREVRSRLLAVRDVMDSCIKRGVKAQGRLPGGLGLVRRAHQLQGSLEDDSAGRHADPFLAMDRVSLHAIAVAEENAAGGRVVTAPTNGSAGIVPAVLDHAVRSFPGSSDDLAVDFLLAAGAIGTLFKHRASISGAEVGCQGEVGVACSMAAAGLAQVSGGTPRQVERAAEIGMEHNLGLTCDPVGGLVQIPCIERNALGAVMAIASARLAMRGSARHVVPLDSVIEAMLKTGRDMHDDYKETARGGLAAVLRSSGHRGVEC